MSLDQLADAPPPASCSSSSRPTRTGCSSTSSAPGRRRTVARSAAALAAARPAGRAAALLVNVTTADPSPADPTGVHERRDRAPRTRAPVPGAPSRPSVPTAPAEGRREPFAAVDVHGRRLRARLPRTADTRCGRSTSAPATTPDARALPGRPLLRRRSHPTAAGWPTARRTHLKIQDGRHRGRRAVLTPGVKSPAMPRLVARRSHHRVHRPATGSTRSTGRGRGPPARTRTACRTARSLAPSWSPDGHAIAFLDQRPRAGTRRRRQLPGDDRSGADGTGLRAVHAAGHCVCLGGSPPRADLEPGRPAGSPSRSTQSAGRRGHLHRPTRRHRLAAPRRRRTATSPGSRCRLSRQAQRPRPKIRMPLFQHTSRSQSSPSPSRARPSSWWA